MNPERKNRLTRAKAFAEWFYKDEEMLLECFTGYREENSVRTYEDFKREFATSQIMHMYVLAHNGGEEKKVEKFIKETYKKFAQGYGADSDSDA